MKTVANETYALLSIITIISVFNAQQMELPPLTFSLNSRNLKTMEKFSFILFPLKEVPSVLLKVF